MVVKDEEYDVTRFFPVWRELSPNSSIGPYAVGKLKLRIRFEPTRDATPALLPPATQPPTRLPFLPANFGDALNLKRKQLKNSVAPEHNSLPTTTQLQLHPLEFDATASEKIMREIERDAVLANFAPDQVEFVKPIGEGIHSCVYHGRWVHGAEGRHLTKDIAIKEFRYVNSFPPPNVLATFRHEYQLLELCARENACNVVRYLGVLLKPRPAIITEFFPCGSLAACMKDGPTWSQVSLVK
uniref:Protein kinase domain-containing protein n=1 Tax=Globisporangium ultimum (strain ATCC 200006 / CBS 805.95 / DAOM BR144) TaxID=431595 RepID=K3WL29_GLOUD